MTEFIFKAGQDWTPELLAKAWDEIEEVAKELKVSYYSPQVEIVSAKQMLDAYTSTGMPVMYRHWSFGKEFVFSEEQYLAGKMGLAYELVINSNPCIAYLMEENNMVLQTLVMAHASVGHSAVFKNNYLFKNNTDAAAIVDYLNFAKVFIKRCEEKYGYDEVEETLDAAHSLSNYGVDKYKKPKPLSPAAEEKRALERFDDELELYDPVWEKTKIKRGRGKAIGPEESPHAIEYLKDPEENILYFVEKNAPRLAPWKREIIRIIRKMSHYFHPQRQCLTGNHLVSTPNGLIRLRDLIKELGHVKRDGISLLTDGNKFTPISHTYLEPNALVQRIKTASGRTFTITPEHPLTALIDHKHILQEAKSLKVGNHLVVNLNYNPFATNLVSLENPPFRTLVECELCKFKSSYLSTHLTQTHKISTKNYHQKYPKASISSEAHRLNKSVNKIKSPEILSEGLGELLGYIVFASKLFTIQSGFTFSFKTFELAKKCSKLLAEIFNIQVLPHLDSFGLYKIGFSSWELRRFLEYNFDDLNFNTRALQIPKKILSSPREVVARFIRATIDCRAIRRSDISHFSLEGYPQDQEVFETLLTLLGGMGIIGRIKSGFRITAAGMGEILGLDLGEHRVNCEVCSFSIDPSSRFKFETVIGTSTNLKMHNQRAKSPGSLHLVPGGVKLLREVGNFINERKKSHALNSVYASLKNYTYKKARLGLQIKQQGWVSINDIPSIRSTELSIEDVIRQGDKFENLKKVGCSQADLLYKISQLALTHFYDEIISIEVLNEPQDVYDVTVPENHLFWVDGVISHNTKVLNEGFATFTHYYIMTRLWEKGLIDAGTMIEFYGTHGNVINQRSGAALNPYKLGFSIFMDIKRICEAPTAEDRYYFPRLAGKNWVEEVRYAMENFKDETFILQYLSPKVCRDMQLFAFVDDMSSPNYEITEISDETSFRDLREKLASQYAVEKLIPNVQIVAVDSKGTRKLMLKHFHRNGQPLNLNDARKVVQYLAKLWEYSISLETIEYSEQGEIEPIFLISSGKYSSPDK